MKRWCVCMLMLCSLAVVGQAQNRRPVLTGEKAKVVDAYGTVQKRTGTSGSWQNVNVGDLLLPQTTVKTGENAAALLLLPDNHAMRIGEKTTVELRELGKDKSFSFKVLGGQIWSMVRKTAKPAKYEIETPSAVVGVSGTVFSVFHNDQNAETTVSTGEGQVQVTQEGESQSVGPGMYCSLRRIPPPPAGAGVSPHVIKVLPMKPAMRKMWQMMRDQEGWRRPAGPVHLNRTVEPQVRVFLRGPRRPGNPLYPHPPRPGQKPPLHGPRPPGSPGPRHRNGP